MREKTDALVLRSTDYRDNDKILTLFTPDEGKQTAVMRGVKKSGARLRFAAEPFCFAEYVFAGKAGRNTVISASLYDGFYAVRTDLAKYYAACAVCEACNLLLPEGAESGAFFTETVRALEQICYDDEKEGLARFLLQALAFAGVAPDLDCCGVCGGALQGQRLYFDFDTGRFSCPACHKGIAANGHTYEYLTKLGGLPFSLPEGETDAPVRAIRLLAHYLFRKTET